jgi:hypothetical protein
MPALARLPRDEDDRRETIDTAKAAGGGDEDARVGRAGVAGVHAFSGVS